MKYTLDKYNQLSFISTLVGLPPEYSNVYTWLVNLPMWYWGHQNYRDTILKRKFLYEYPVCYTDEKGVVRTKKESKYMNLTVKGTTTENGKFQFLSLNDMNVLDALLYLSTQPDVKREKDKKDGCYVIELTNNKIYETLNKKIVSTEIRKSIMRIRETSLYISDENGKNFVSIDNIITQYGEKDRDDENNGKRTIYYIKWNSKFTDEIERNITNIINYEVLLSLKNPMSKYLMKKMVMWNYWSIKEPDRYYHTNSLFDLLMNSGYEFDTEVHKNNSMSAFRTAIRELTAKGLLKEIQFEPIKERNKIVDYKIIKMIPSDDIIKNTLNQPTRMGNKRILHSGKKKKVIHITDPEY